MRFSSPSNYLKHTDIPEDHDTVVTIASYAEEEIGQGEQKKKKWVVYFEEMTLGLVLNKTNGTAICKALNTDEMDEWTGHKIGLWVKDDVEFQGDIVSAIRVRVKVPKG